MSTTKLNIGKIPISKGEYQEGTAYQRLNQVTMLGSTYQSKIDDNTSTPAQMGSDGSVENINTDKWLCIAVGNVSAARKVVYNNETSGLEAGNVQEAIDEVGSKVSDLQQKNKSQDKEISKKANSSEVTSQMQTEQERVNTEFTKKFDKESILQEPGDAEDKVMSQKSVSTELRGISSNLGIKSDGLPSLYVNMGDEGSGLFSFSTKDVGSSPVISVKESSNHHHTKLSLPKGSKLEYMLYLSSHIEEPALVFLTLDGKISSIVVSHDVNVKTFIADKDYIVYVNSEADYYVRRYPTGAFEQLAKDHNILSKADGSKGYNGNLVETWEKGVFSTPNYKVGLFYTENVDKDNERMYHLKLSMCKGEVLSYNIYGSDISQYQPLCVVSLTGEIIFLLEATYQVYKGEYTATEDCFVYVNCNDNSKYYYVKKPSSGVYKEIENLHADVSKELSAQSLEIDKKAFGVQGFVSRPTDWETGVYTTPDYQVGSNYSDNISDAKNMRHIKILLCKNQSLSYNIYGSDLSSYQPLCVVSLSGEILFLLNADYKIYEGTYTATEDCFVYVNCNINNDGYYVATNSIGIYKDIEDRYLILSSKDSALFKIKDKGYNTTNGELTDNSYYGSISTERIKLLDEANNCRIIVCKSVSCYAFVFFDADGRFISNSAFEEEIIIPRNAVYFAATVHKTGSLEAIILREPNNHYDSRKILIPSTIYSLNNKELTFYKKPICKGMLSFDGLSQNLEYARIKPTSNSTCNVVSYCDGIGKQKKKIAINVCNGTSGNSIKVCALGDSITQMQAYVRQAHNLLQDVEFVASWSSADDINVEGRGGWTMDMYFNLSTKGTTGYGSNINTLSPFIHPKGEGYYYGSTSAAATFVSQDKLVEAIGFESNGLKSSPQIGDVMYDDNSSVSSTPGYVIYDGEKWAEKNISPDTYFAFSIEKYIAAWKVDFDIISIMLGTNDFIGTQPYCDVNTDKFINNMNTIVEQAKALNKKVVVMLPTSIGILDGTSYFGSSLHEGYVKLREDLIYNYDNRQSEGIYLCDFGGAIDPIFGYNQPKEEKPFEEYTLEDDREWGNNTPTPSSERKRIILPNDVHPTYNGAKQGGTRYAGTLQYIREN